MYLGGANIREPVHRQCRFMGDDAVRAGAADLRPQDGFHVLAEWGNRVARKPVNASRDSLDILAAFELYQAYQMQPGRARLCGRKITGSAFGQAIERGIPATWSHRNGKSIMSWNSIDESRIALCACGWTVRQVSRRLRCSRSPKECGASTLMAAGWAVH
jgi:hypothetical protein